VCSYWTPSAVVPLLQAHDPTAAREATAAAAAVAVVAVVVVVLVVAAAVAAVVVAVVVAVVAAAVVAAVAVAVVAVVAGSSSDAAWEEEYQTSKSLSLSCRSRRLCMRRGCCVVRAPLHWSDLSLSLSLWLKALHLVRVVLMVVW
jgi:hypothetical protein